MVYFIPCTSSPCCGKAGEIGGIGMLDLFIRITCYCLIFQFYIFLYFPNSFSSVVLLQQAVHLTYSDYAPCCRCYCLIFQFLYFLLFSIFIQQYHVALQCSKQHTYLVYPTFFAKKEIVLLIMLCCSACNNLINFLGSSQSHMSIQAAKALIERYPQ